MSAQDANQDPDNNGITEGINSEDTPSSSTVASSSPTTLAQSPSSSAASSSASSSSPSSSLQTLNLSSLGVPHAQFSVLLSTLYNRWLSASGVLTRTIHTLANGYSTLLHLREQTLQFWREGRLMASIDRYAYYRPQIVIFPEGTTTNGSAVVTFHQGAFVPGVAVQPVLIRYPYSHFSPAYPMGVSLPRLFFQLLCQFRNDMEVHFMDVYLPSEEEKRNPALYANNVRKIMAEKLNVAVTNHTYEDALLLNEALSYNMKPACINVEVEKVKRLYKDMSLHELKLLLWRFKHIDTDADGVISYQEFARSLGLPEGSSYVKDLFSVLDTDESGAIDFREFVLGIAALNHKLNTKQIVELAFAAFDRDGDGYITTDELRQIFKQGLGCTEDQQLDKLLRRIDHDKHGKVRLEEFVKFVNTHPEYVHFFAYLTSKATAATEKQ